MLMIDGSQGEGGGQILRSSLALSAITGKPFRMDRIRANRANPGLARQHLASVHAAATISSAVVEGDQLGSSCLTFRPNAVRPGKYRFAVGTAGSATLVLQTVLPPLMIADGPSELTLEGGTHNEGAPPFEFLSEAFLPLVSRMGPRVVAELERPGFYPHGGGRFRVQVVPVSRDRLRRLDLTGRDPLHCRRVRAVVVGLPRHIAERELSLVARTLPAEVGELELAEFSADRQPIGQGNYITISLRRRQVTEVIVAVGQRGRPAEQVAQAAVDRARRLLRLDVSVGEHLADQLLLPMALAGGGALETVEPTLHTRTNAAVIAIFLPVALREEQLDANRWRLLLAPAD